MEGLERVVYGERLNWDCSAWRGGGWWFGGDLIGACEYLKGGVMMREPGLSQWCPVTEQWATGTGRNTENFS